LLLFQGNKSLQFLLTPWVHGTETMATCLKEDGMYDALDGPAEEIYRLSNPAAKAAGVI
jgi:hypothetical protein